LSALIHLGYLGMFLSAFLAATILPFSSEIVLSALYGSGLNGAILLVVASIGNVLGSLVNYLLGYAFGKDIATQKLNISEATFNRASSVFTRWGKWSLFLCWVPIIGDPITLVAGVLRSPLWFFMLAVTLSKTGRYAALLYVLS
jgi:membrane protein YqaA with SNARE-associated domain